MGADLSFPSCSPLTAASFRVSSRQRRAGEGQKEAVKPLANRSRHRLEERCISRQRAEIKAAGIAAVNTPDSIRPALAEGASKARKPMSLANKRREPNGSTAERKWARYKTRRSVALACALRASRATGVRLPGSTAQAPVGITGGILPISQKSQERAKRPPPMRHLHRAEP